jgi:hypothetical protein
MLDSLTLSTFEPLIGEHFAVVVDPSQAFEMRLSAVVPWGEAPAGARRPFKLLFHAPHEALVRQRTYRVLSDHLPPLDLFLVPLGPDATGTRYEAVFS